MESALPDRPLAVPEIESLVEEDAFEFVIPAGPESIRYHPERPATVVDLLVVREDDVAALAYDDAESWTVVEQTDDESPYDTVYDALSEFRDGDVDRNGTVRRMVRDAIEQVSAVSNHGEPPTER